MEKLNKYGFIAPVIEPEHFVLGSSRSLQKDILQADGQWDAYIPSYEQQIGSNWDTAGCTVFGSLNAVEFLFKKIYGLDKNFSERFIYNLVPVRPPGADPHVVSEYIRNYGVVEQEKLPMTTTFPDFCSPTPMTKEMIALAAGWKKKYTVGHEWLFKKTPSVKARTELMKEGLLYSPLGVSVTAWFRDSDGIYRDNKVDNTHWCICYGWDDSKKAWKIFDSYDHSLKLYAYDSLISFCKVYTLCTTPTPAELNERRKNILTKLLEWFKLL